MVTAPPKPEGISPETFIDKTLAKVQATNKVLAIAASLEWYRCPSGDWRLSVRTHQLNAWDASAQTQLGCLLNMARKWHIYLRD